MAGRSKNFDGLKSWVGEVLAHGTALGMPNLVFDGCHLLCHRSVVDIEAMLDALSSLAEDLGDEDWKFEFPDPGYNWKLRGTAIWRLVDGNYKVLSKAIAAERWEFIAAYALYRIRRAVQVLRQEPLGITGIRVAGEDAQQAVAAANRWLSLAQAESRRKDVEARERLRKGGKRGSKSKYRQEGLTVRHEQICQEAENLLVKNPALKRDGIALKLTEEHRGTPGWSRKTINNVLKKNLIA